MNDTHTTHGEQAHARYRLRCTGCGTTASRVLTPLRNNRGHLGFLCPKCESRFDDSTVFQRIVHSCIRCGHTVPEYEAMFAACGLSIPTTAAAVQAASDRVFRGG